MNSTPPPTPDPKHTQRLNYRLFEDTVELESYLLKVPPRFYLHFAKLLQVTTDFLANAVAGSDSK